MRKYIGEDRYNKIRKLCEETLNIITDGVKLDTLTNFEGGNSKLVAVRYLPLINMYINELNEDSTFDLTIYNNISIIDKFFFEGFNGIGPFCGVSSVINIGEDILGKNECIDDFIIDTVKLIARECPGYMSNIDKHPNLEDCNLLDGLSGIGAALLPYYEIEEVMQSIIEILNYIVSFINKKNYYKGDLISSWYYANESRDSIKIDNSMGKGVCGLLSFLSIALKNGLEVDGQKEAINIILKEIDKYEYAKMEIITKSLSNKNEEVIIGEIDYSYISGLSGVARSMYISGCVIKSDYYKDKGLDTLIKISGFCNDKLKMNSPSFGNGTVGLLYLLLITYKETLNKKLINGIINLIDLTLGYYEDKDSYLDNILRYNNSDITYLDNILTVVLSLRECIDEKRTKWDKILLVNY